ncbi:hypothetical protein [Corynebacterium sp. c8Ua_99]|uniref:hypothetical protein n=1 Tax=Corynebacterium sp. c8Ua_99 TaxID=3032335 RepID=UPI0032642B75
MSPNRQPSVDLDKQEEALLHTKAEEASTDTAKSPEAVKTAKAATTDAEEIMAVHKGRLKSDQIWRTVFLCLFTGILILTIVGTGYGLRALVAADEFKGVVATGFFGSVVIQVMGVTIVIAKFFFPEGGGNTEPPLPLGELRSQSSTDDCNTEHSSEFRHN